MRVFFYIGLILLVLSFVAAAAENASHAMPGANRAFILPAYDLWYTFWPKSLLVFEIRFQRQFGDWMWDSVMMMVLQLPAWLILGGPGAALLMYFRPNRGQDTGEEMAEAEEHFKFYNQLTKQAHEENTPGEEHGPRDIMPEHPIDDDEVIDDKTFIPPGKDDKPG